MYTIIVFWRYLYLSLLYILDLFVIVIDILVLLRIIKIQNNNTFVRIYNRTEWNKIEYNQLTKQNIHNSN
jgi:hypothetical protein